ncbi:Uncharacterised protein [uncultured archaeon]|nr:Uncharacterised protein [uncultured archaeon]
MNTEEMYIARCMFKLKIHESNGQSFENFFVHVMGLSNPDFRPVKPQGSLGDRKNDGFDSRKGVYYQIYAPENIKIKQWESLEKLKNDFQGLCDFWENVCKIVEFYYVINDKYMGAFPTTEKALAELKNKYNLKNFDLLLSKHIEDIFLKLNDEDIVDAVGIVPSPNKIENISYSVLDEVIKFILERNEPYNFEEKYPDINFEKKLEFNHLSKSMASLLIKGNYQGYVVDDYFKLNSDFTKQELQKKFKKLYEEGLAKYNLQTQADLIFLHILNNASPQKNKLVQDAVLVLMAYYFEACDIFEEPI